MKKVLLALLFALPAASQTLSVYPVTPIAPRGSYQTVTAIGNGVNNKTVTWSTDFGSIVGTNPCTANEPCTVAVYSSTAGIAHLTATSNANGAVTATATVTFTASPTKATDHPRFLVRSSDLAGLQAKSTVGNPMYQAIKTIASNYYTTDSAIWTFSTWSGSACTGGSGPSSPQQDNYRENDILWMAQMALVAPTSSERNQYGCAAHDMLMTNMGYVLSGALDLSQGNRWADGSLSFAFTPDWLMGYMSSSDKNVIREYLAKLAYLQINNIYNGTLAPIGGYNSPTQFQESDENSITGMRAMSNNYTQARVLILMAAALTFNDDNTDDPSTLGAVVQASVNAGGSGWNVGDHFTLACGAVGIVQSVSGGVVTSVSGGGGLGCATGSAITATAVSPATGTGLTVDTIATNSCSTTRDQVCANGTAGSLHGYWTYTSGGLLYKDWANLEDPNVVQQAYNTAYSNLPSQPQCNTLWHTSIPCLGVSRGGESAEGTFYGYSLARLRWAMTGLYTAGWADPLLYGPQISLNTSSAWDLRYLADSQLLIGLNALQSEASRWSVTSQGDALNYFVYPTQYAYDSAMMAFDSLTGRTDRSNALEWTVLNTAFGMAAGTTGSCASSCGYVTELSNDYASGTAFDAFIALPAANPVTTSPPTDPRPNFPTDWYAFGNKHVNLRDNWTTGATNFSYYCIDTQIDHEHEICGRYDISVGGDTITKGRQGFNDYNTWAWTGANQNTLNILNSTNTIAQDQYPWGPTSATGGQFWHGYQAGLNTFYHSELPTYAAMIADDTNDYNGGNGIFLPANDVQKASRSLIYLRSSNRVITYDRANVGHAASLQTLHQNTTGSATITGNQAVWTTRAGTHKAAFTAITGGTLTKAGLLTHFQVTAPFSSIHVGDTMQLTCTAYFADGTTQDCTTFPAPSTGLIAQWTTDHPSNVTISSSGLLTAVSTATGIAVNGAYGFPGFDPGNATMTINVVSGSSSGSASTTSSNNLGNDWEPSQNLIVTPAGTPTSSRFLSDLHWGNSSLSPDNPTLNSSSAGQNFDCAFTVGETTMVCFMKDWPATFTGTTYHALGATHHYIADLTPNTTYSISAAGAPTSGTTDSAGVLVFNSAGTGDVSITSGGTPTASTPTFSPGAGTYAGSQTVTISTTSSGAVICYNTTGAPQTNGSTGCTTGTLYTGPVTVASSETLYAVAGGTGYLDSSIGSAAYIINPPVVANPAFSPVAGTYTSPQTVSISTSTSGATICYTSDGSTPTTNGAGTCTHGTPYTGTISIGATTTLKAIGSKSGYTDSSVVTALYNINLPSVSIPVASPAGGTYFATQTVTLTDSTSGAAICYTLDGTTPTATTAGTCDGLTYSTPLTISSTTTLKAIGTKVAYLNSAVDTEVYTITPPSGSTVTVTGTVTITGSVNIK